MMKWITGICAGLVCGALITLGGMTAMQTHNTYAASSTQVLKFVLHEDGIKFVVLDKNKDALGDMLVMVDSLYDAANKKLVGHVNGACIRTQLGKQFECSGTTEFADNSGQISWEGPFKDHEKSGFLTVTGGTQAYENVHGQVEFFASETKDAIAPIYQVVVTIAKG